ncbi:MAG: hypothetical protein L0Y72_12615 [Gemmataceae bacterium]|nr:hypothetical protein [Gemmataceae bacterium]MCI0739881.1 hypothetical protein [Gemmataceae bacterium]
MGHQRLGEISNTQKWKKVVEKITSALRTSSPQGVGEIDVESIATQILQAAEGGLHEAVNDPGLQSTVFLLTQIVLAARAQDWQSGLDTVGIRLHSDATVFDLTAEVQRVIDQDVRRHGRPTTIGEIARQAAGEALAELTRDQAISLFGSGRDELQHAVKNFSTKAGFCDLGQRFFGNFTARYLDSYASKIVPRVAGSGALLAIQHFSEFRQSLFQHCYQSAKIVHDFSGEWYSKTEWEKGIDRQNTRGFVAVAIQKLGQELKKQREGIK